MNFSLILDTIRAFLFILNPLTWVEIRNDWPQTERHWCLQWWERVRRFGRHGVCAFMALGMRLTVGYLVCVDSVSVILNCGSAGDAIFNSLAITFIVDLSKCWWDFC